MSVYVDKAQNPYGRMKMCHMMADTLDELHAMAEKIGMKRAWFQDHPDHPHYDLSKSKRALAIQYGAIELENHQLVMWLRAQRERRKIIMPKYGPNVTKLITKFIAREAVPPGGGLSSAIEFISDPERRKQVLESAEAKAIQAIKLIKSAPDNPFGDDDEQIAGEILKRINERVK